MLNSQQLEKFARDGFVAGSIVLTPEEVEVLRAETLRVIENRDDLENPPVSLRNISSDESPVWQIVNIWHTSEPFRVLVNNPTIAAEVVQLTGAQELRLFHDQIQFKPAQKGGVNMWHQDSPYWPILQPKTTQITAWVALDDVDLDNGCMQMVPGSQVWGERLDFLHTLKKFEDMPAQWESHPLEIVACPVKAGQVHYHHPLTWHGSNSNLSGRPRRAIALHFMNENTVFDAKGLHPMKPLVEVRDGEKVVGDAFPLVYSN